MSGKFIIVSAPSGSGKTTIVKKLMESFPVLEFSVSAASRAPRPHEINGKDYFFLSVPEFREKIAKGELLEWQEVYKDQYYGTLKSEVDRIWENGHHVLFDVDVQGGMNLKAAFPDISLAIFIMPPSLQELEERLRLRGTETAESIRTRVAKAATEINFAPHFDRIIVNDILDNAVAEAISAVNQFLGHD